MKKDPLEPKDYVPSTSDPEWPKHETEYVLKHLITDREVKKLQASVASSQEQTLIKRLSGRYYLEQIQQGWRKSPNSEDGHSFSDKAAECVVQAVREFGLDALRLPPEKGQRLIDNPLRRLEHWIKSAKDLGFESIPFSDLELWIKKAKETKGALEPLKIMDELGAAVCSAVRYWQRQARHGRSLAERRRAKDYLNQIAKTLIPDTRGKRGTLAAPPRLVKAFYYEQLFRLYHVKRTLHSGSGSKSNRVKLASENFGLSVEQIREFWGLDDEDKPLRGSGPLTLKDMARELAARHFGITHQTVLNILAS